jgi:hypothetical protein
MVFALFQRGYGRAGAAIAFVDGIDVVVLLDCKGGSYLPSAPNKEKSHEVPSHLDG